MTTCCMAVDRKHAVSPVAILGVFFVNAFNMKKINGCTFAYDICSISLSAIASTSASVRVKCNM